MKKYLISENGNCYKANLHCHTKLSDGKMSPEEVKKVYMENGYSIIAFTDHDVFLLHHDLTDDDFLALNGFEVEINQPHCDKWCSTKTCHICFVATDPEIKEHPLWHRSDYLFGNASEHRDEVIFDESLPDYVRNYTSEGISEMMRIGREKGFFVTYNHPIWSLESYEQYINYNGMHAMEIYNHGCWCAGFHEYNTTVYDDMLRAGKQIYCMATDDNHSSSDTCGGFVMIKAEKLEYKTITDALLRGDFYASRGPEIKAIWFDDSDNTVHIECSEAKRIIWTTGVRASSAKNAKGSDYLTSAIFNVSGHENYFRITVIDKDGLTADTNAYFVDELINKGE